MVQSLGFAEGIMVGMSKRPSAGGPRVFDWDKAAQLIRERKPRDAEAGLAEDWGCTGGSIYGDGEPVPRSDTYTYLASKWATPTLIIDGEEVECWKAMNGSGWTAETYWPESALAILNGEQH